MSGSTAKTSAAAAAVQTSQVAKAAKTDGANDPSMEDILSSIRRILSEDEAGGDDAPEEDDDGVLELDESMRIDAEPEPAADAFAAGEPDPIPPPVIAAEPQLPPLRTAAAASPLLPSIPVSSGGLLADAAAQAAAASMGELVRSLGGERNPRVYSTGPTLEDIVIEALRPLLKSWLDENLPPIVERLVRHEIERVTSRAMGG